MSKLKDAILNLSVNEQIELGEWIDVNARAIALTLRRSYPTENQRTNRRRVEVFVARMNLGSTSHYLLELTIDPLRMHIVTYDDRGCRVVRFRIDLDTGEVRSGGTGEALCYLPDRSEVWLETP